MLFCKKGEFVTNSTYDAFVYDDENLIAVVGFNAKQLDGALFWQLVKKYRNCQLLDYDKISLYDSEEIKSIARDYIKAHNIVFPSF
jgi:hypothetical protein